MREAEPSRVECEARRRQTAWLAIAAIPADRMPHALEVDSHLVGPARLQTHS